MAVVDRQRRGFYPIAHCPALASTFHWKFWQSHPRPFVPCGVEPRKLVEPSKEFMCELRKRIVARAHNHDAITPTGQPDQHVATGAAVWKSKGLSAAPLDFANNIVASDATVDRTAKINGFGHD